MLMVTGQDLFRNTFRYQYLYNFLRPIYEIKVDDVAILRIWKNSKEYSNNTQGVIEQFERAESVVDEKKETVFKLKERKALKTLTVLLPNATCKEKAVGASVYISDDDARYLPKDEGLGNFSEREVAGYNADFVVLFPGDEAQYIKVVYPKNYPCEQDKTRFQLFTLKEDSR